MLNQIKSAQAYGTSLKKIVDEVRDGKRPEFRVIEDGVQQYGNRICVHNKKEIREFTLR